MCGIIGYVGPRSTTDMVLAGLRSLEYRGYDSAGIAVVDNGELHLLRSQGKLDNLIRTLDTRTTNGSYGLGHTRWATHGRPNEENAHPHRDCSGSLVVVHNGIIENYLSLKKQLADEGHRFVTETDTEVIAHLLEKHFKKDLLEAVRLSLAELEGVFAFVALSTKEPERLVATRMGPPLVAGVGDGENFIASDIPAFLSHTKTAVFLDDGDISVVDRDQIRFYDHDGNEVQREEQRITWDPVQVEKQGYKHFMLKEIFEQPQAVRDTLLGRYSLDTGIVHLDGIELEKGFLRNLGRITILACGTSWLAAQVGKFMIESAARIPVDVDVASEYRYRSPILGKNDLVIGLTQSGETADTLAALKLAKELGARTMAICNVTGSMATRVCDDTLYTHAGPEIGVAATKTFTSQLVALSLLSVYLGQRLGKLTEENSVRLLSELARSPQILEQMVSVERSIETVAREFYLVRNFLFLGRGPLYPIALEGALKLKEISYIHAEGYAAGEMKHGPIALIDERMPVVALALDNPLFEKLASNIQEAKARGARIIAVGTEGDPRLNAIIDPDKDQVIWLPPHPESISPIISAVPLQLLAYHIAVRLGCDVDQPRNLAKSVTVE